jgi:hypothetical protein
VRFKADAAFLGSVDVIVLVLSVPMLGMFIAVSVRVSVSSKNEEADKVGRKPKGSNYENKFRVFNFRWVDESGNSLEHDGKAERDQEYGV